MDTSFTPMKLRLLSVGLLGLCSLAFAGIIANKSHHATTPDEKYRVVPYQELYIDCGFSSAAEALVGMSPETRSIVCAVASHAPHAASARLSPAVQPHARRASA